MMTVRAEFVEAPPRKDVSIFDPKRTERRNVEAKLGGLFFSNVTGKRTQQAGFDVSSLISAMIGT